MAKLNPKSIQNPFQDTDLLTEIIRQDISIKERSKQAYQTFKSKYYRKPKPQTLTFMSRIFKTISTHSTAFIIGLVLAGSAVGASAAQLVAPENLKPSTIFNELFKPNKQVEKNPYTALKPDANNDVVKVDGCDLAIKYPKMLKDIKVDSFELDPEKYFDKATNGVWLNALPDLNKPYGEQKQINTFNIQCSPTNPILPENEVGYDIVKPEVIQKLTGWFIAAETNVGPIRILKPYEGAKAPFSNYHFEYNKKFYEVVVSTEESVKAQGYDKGYTDQMINVGGIYADQVQIQFNSLVSNESNVKPKPAIKPIKDDGKQAIDIKFKNESKLFKYVNDLVTVKTEAPESAVCGVPNAITYRSENKNRFSPDGSYMTIGNKKDYINDKDLNNSYNRVQTYLSDPNDKLTDTLTGAFITFCAGGYYSNYVQDITGISYPKTDIAKIVLTREGQSEFGDLVVRVYAKKGDNIMVLAKSLTTEEESNKALEGYNLIANSCIEKTNQGDSQGEANCKKKSSDYVTKYEDSQITPAKIANAKIEAQKLVDLFAIK